VSAANKSGNIGPEASGLAPIRAASWQRHWMGDQTARQGTPASIMKSTRINRSDRLEFASFHLKEQSWCCKT